MIGIKFLAGAATPALLKQVTVSVLATLIATSVLTALRAEWSLLHPQATPPALTSGGKFAARIEALEAAPGADMTLTLPAPPVPLLAAVAIPAPAPSLGDAASAPPMLQIAATKTAEPAKPVRRVTARTETKRRAAAADVVHDVVPPRRADLVAVAADAAPAMTVEASDVWSATKTMARQAVWLGGSVLDQLNPARLIP